MDFTQYRQKERSPYIIGGHVFAYQPDFQLTIGTSLILLVFMVFFAYINIETLKTMLLEAAISDADKLSETIIKSTHYEMLEG